MNQELMYYLTNNSGSLSINEILMNFFVALVIGLLIFLSYMFSHSGATYSQKFNVSLWMITIVTTLIMCVIGNNVALSLGMVGALSIVRFRTAIKDPRDTAYVFWCVAVGVCCGISDYIIAIVGSLIIFTMMLILGNAKSNERFLLIVRESEYNEKTYETIDALFKNKAKLKVKNISEDYAEAIYEISEKTMAAAGGAGKIIKTMKNISSVQHINIVSQSDEIRE